jgi:hypothetical protein
MLKLISLILVAYFIPVRGFCSKDNISKKPAADSVIIYKNLNPFTLTGTDRINIVTSSGYCVKVSFSNAQVVMLEPFLDGRSIYKLEIHTFQYGLYGTKHSRIGGESRKDDFYRMFVWNKSGVFMDISGYQDFVGATSIPTLTNCTAYKQGTGLIDYFYYDFHLENANPNDSMSMLYELNKAKLDTVFQETGTGQIYEKDGQLILKNKLIRNHYSKKITKTKKTVLCETPSLFFCEMNSLAEGESFLQRSLKSLLNIKVRN